MTVPDIASTPRQAIRVLVVEDSPSLRHLIEKMLHDHGYATATCVNGVEAVEAVAEAERADAGFDMVLMDVVMPVLNGVDATYRLRKRGYRGRVVMLTAVEESYDMACSFMAGADDFLAKPFTPDQLETAIERCLASPAANPLLQAADRGSRATDDDAAAA